MDTIKANNVFYQVADHVILDDIGPFSMDRNDLICVSGPSGGGKTTFLNVLCGLVTPQKGEVVWGDTDIYQANKKINIDRLRLDWISMIFQEPRLAKQLSGWENIYLPLKISGRFKTIDNQLLEQLLAILFLSDDMTKEKLDQKLKKKVSTYSGGQMQRIAIIRALITSPKYIFADEILNSVEPELQDKVWVMIKQICRQRNIGFLLVTHNSSLLGDQDFTQNIRVDNGVFTK